MQRFKKAKKAKKEADRLHKITTGIYRVVWEFDGGYVVDNETYRSVYRELCNDIGTTMKLIYTAGYQFEEIGFDNIEDCKKQADKRSEFIGGKWHVVFNKELNQYIEVWDDYVKKNNVVSLYETEDNKDIDINEWLKDIGMNRQQRRNITHNLKKKK